MPCTITANRSSWPFSMRIQLIATARTMFNFPKPSVGREGSNPAVFDDHRPDFRQSQAPDCRRRLPSGVMWTPCQILIRLLRLQRSGSPWSGRHCHEQVAVLWIVAIRDGLAHRLDW